MPNYEDLIQPMQPFKVVSQEHATTYSHLVFSQKAPQNKMHDWLLWGVGLNYARTYTIESSTKPAILGPAHHGLASSDDSRNPNIMSGSIKVNEGLGSQPLRPMDGRITVR